MRFRYVASGLVVLVGALLGLFAQAACSTPQTLAPAAAEPAMAVPATLEPAVVVAETAVPAMPYMKMNPPPDSDKPVPIPGNDNSCWMHTAANMLAGAGYGTGNTVQARADDIFGDMAPQYRLAGGGYPGGWIDAALQWWLASAHNTDRSNPYSLVTVYGSRNKVPWANAQGARDLGNHLRQCNLVGVSISYPDPTQPGGKGGHAMTSWGDAMTQTTTLTGNPTALRLTDSDSDAGGNVQSHTYDAFNAPNPGGANEGNGWYLQKGANHPFIKHIVTLSPVAAADTAPVRALGSWQISQMNADSAIGLHYVASTDVDILSYRTWLDWEAPAPIIVEDHKVHALTVDWDFSRKTVPFWQDVKITTEMIEPRHNAITYSDVRFVYPKAKDWWSASVSWRIDTPTIENAEAIPNVCGGYVIGRFELSDPAQPDADLGEYRLIHQYRYDQSPESHVFRVSGSPGLAVSGLRFGHAYGYPTVDELWAWNDWLTATDVELSLSESEVDVHLDWTGRLPYPEGDGGH